MWCRLRLPLYMRAKHSHAHLFIAYLPLLLLLPPPSLLPRRRHHRRMYRDARARSCRIRCMVSLFIHIYANTLAPCLARSLTHKPIHRRHHRLMHSIYSILCADTVEADAQHLFQRQICLISLSPSHSLASLGSARRRRFLENANGDGFDAT